MNIKQIEKYCKSYIQREEQLINTEVIEHSSEYYIFKAILEFIIQYEGLQREVEELSETIYTLTKKKENHDV